MTSEHGKQTAEHVKKELSLGLWEKYLTLWIALCIVAGLLPALETVNFPFPYLLAKVSAI